jgi:lipopolysaccharide/colanic/teichoic acid biosynthesis glycosyltransferase
MEPSPPPQLAERSSAYIPTPPGRRHRRETEFSRSVDRARPHEAARHERAQTVEQVYPRERNETASRVLNVIVAAIGLVVVAPLCLVIAVLIKLTSKGPIFYAQTRVGLDRRWRETLPLHERRQEDLGGVVFTIYKFRTMRVDAERKSGAVWAKENDPRVTPLGRFLRKWRIDEIPQLWNVMKGEMNVVGPRPERPSIVARLRDDIPEYAFRHRVKPGLTGLAQVNQEYDACLDDVRGKVNWDLRYLKSQSLWLDIRIMLQTFPSVLLKHRGW